MGAELTAQRQRWLPERAATLPSWKIALAQRMRGLTVAQQADAIAAALSGLLELHGDRLTPKQWKQLGDARALVREAMLP